MKNKIKLSSLLKFIINSLWYIGLGLSTVLLFIIIVFNISVYTDWKVNFPTFSFQMSDFSYRFNEKHLEVIKIDRAIDRCIGNEIIRLPDFQREYIKSLYNFNFTGIPAAIKIKDYWAISLKELKSIKEELDNSYPPLRYYEHKYVPRFSSGLTIYLLISITFILIILFNLKKISDTVNGTNIFSNENAIRLKVIAIYFILAELMRLLIFHWVNSSIANMNSVSIAQYNIFTRLNYNLTWSDVNYWIIFIGVVISLIAWLIHSGIAIKEENELTV